MFNFSFFTDEIPTTMLGNFLAECSRPQTTLQRCLQDSEQLGNNAYEGKALMVGPGANDEAANDAGL